MVITYHLHGAPQKKSFQCDFCRMSSPGPLQQQPMGTSAGCCVFTRKTWEIHGKTKGKPWEIHGISLSLPEIWVHCQQHLIYVS